MRGIAPGSPEPHTCSKSKSIVDHDQEYFCMKKGTGKNPDLDRMIFCIFSNIILIFYFLSRQASISRFSQVLLQMRSGQNEKYHVLIILVIFDWNKFIGILWFKYFFKKGMKIYKYIYTSISIYLYMCIYMHIYWRILLTRYIIGVNKYFFINYFEIFVNF